MRELFGYDEVSVPKEKREELFALCFSLGIEATHEREYAHRVNVRVFSGDAERLREALSDAGIAAKEEGQGGALWVLKKARTHPGLLIGIVLSLALYLFLSGMIWEVRITSPTDIDEDRVLGILSECGLSEGAWRRSLDPDEISARYLLLDGETAFATVHLSGMVAEVELIAKEDGEEPPPPGKPCNIVATRDAVISDVTVYAGKCLVRPGTAVAAGDILVSGVISDVGGSRFLHASADVRGTVSDTLDIRIPAVTETVSVGKTHTVGVRLCVFGKTVSFGSNDAGDISKTRRVYLFGKVRLPVSLSISENAVCEQITCERDEEQLAKLARAKLFSALSETIGDGALISREETATFDGTTYTLTCHITYEANIAKSLAFDIE